MRGVILILYNLNSIMVYLPIITAIISGLLVWALGRWNANKDERKQEKKRLSRLQYAGIKALGR
ncbi:hypothetical protein SAMN04487890_101826 [Mucilaginibacter polytrichastri]|nr:hypothetical protein SAMN04487890_101826 [Mucilaginibacter polytrichastri]